MRMKPLPLPFFPLRKNFPIIVQDYGRSLVANVIRLCLIEIIRTRDESALANMDIVVDVGGVYDPAHHRYDHHQPTFLDRFSPRFHTLLSSAGLVYKHFAKEIIANSLPHGNEQEDVELLFEKLYEVFVEPFDAHDNGISAYPPNLQPRFHRPWDIFAQVNALNPAWNETTDDVDDRFGRAVELVKSNFLTVLNYYCNSWLPGRAAVRKNLIPMAVLFTDEPLDPILSRQVLILSSYAPWSEFIHELEEEQNEPGRFKYVIFPESGTTSAAWRIAAVPVSKDSFESRLALPESWRGLRDAQLDEAINCSTEKGAIFVHRSGFIGGHRTQKGALKMSILALKQASSNTQ
jgi:uncharacterized UPF0160 family protein